MMADPQIGVGVLPGHKRPALWVAREGEVRVLAWFRDRAAMEEFVTWKPMSAATGTRVSEEPRE